MQACVRRESRSLFQYVRDVPLWVSPADRPILAKLHGLAATEQTATDKLGRYLQRRTRAWGILERSRADSPRSTTPLCITSCRSWSRSSGGAVGALEADLARVTDADARDHLAALLQLKRQHLPELESLSAGPHTLL